MSGPLALALALALGLVPHAAAVDLLPTQVVLGEDEARLLVRSAGRGVRVSAEPAVLAAGVAPGALAEALAPTPVAVDASYMWRGLEGIVEIVLRRDDARQAVDIIVEDSANVGVWVEWPPAPRAIPAQAGVAALLVALLVRRAAARN